MPGIGRADVDAAVAGAEGARGEIGCGIGQIAWDVAPVAGSILTTVNPAACCPITATRQSRPPPSRVGKTRTQLTLRTGMPMVWMDVMVLSFLVFFAVTARLIREDGHRFFQGAVSVHGLGPFVADGTFCNEAENVFRAFVKSWRYPGLVA